MLPLYALAFVFCIKPSVSQLFMEHHLTATECHLPWDHTVLPATYVPPDTSERTPPSPVGWTSPRPVRPVLDLPTPEGWKAELT